MRIRWRLALYGALVSAVTMIIFGLVLVILAERSARDDQVKMLAATAIEVATAMEAGGWQAPPPGATIDPALATDGFVTVMNADATVMANSGTVTVFPAAFVLEAQAIGASTITFTSGDVELRADARSWSTPGGGTGVVVVAQSTRFVTDQVETVGGFIAFAALITLVVSPIVAYFVSGRAMRPLRRLAETTDDIGNTGDLSKRLPPVRAKDEVGALTASFNGMLEQLHSAQSGLESSLETQRRFVADASHELRSPLTTIRSNAGFLVERPDADSSDRNEAIADIAAEADRMAALVDDLLTLAIADAEPGGGPSAVDMAAIVDGVARRAELSGVGIEVFGDDHAVAAGDREALERLVWILVDNAMKHGDGIVEVTAENTGDSVTLTVADGGSGLLPGEIDRVFERFYRGDPARSPAGAGLGLAIAKQIVDASAGTISAANRAEGGAEFTVVLPAA